MMQNIGKLSRISAESVNATESLRKLLKYSARGFIWKLLESVERFVYTDGYHRIWATFGNFDPIFDQRRRLSDEDVLAGHPHAADSDCDCRKILWGIYGAYSSRFYLLFDPVYQNWWRCNRCQLQTVNDTEGL